MAQERTRRHDRPRRLWRRHELRSTLSRLYVAIRDDDEPAVRAIVSLSRRHRLFAPLALTVGSVVALLHGVRLLFKNWRLTLVQVLPAFWVWVATADLKVHVLHGHSFHVLRGWVLVPINLAIVAITVGAYFLNAVFAYAITQPGAPRVRPAFASARAHLAPVLVNGVLIGAALGFATTIVTRWGHPWFALCLGVVIALMTVTYVAVPARLIGAKKTKRSRRDALTASAVSSALSFTVCTPPYLLGRIGLLMIGSSVLRIPGVICLATGATLQAGATGAVSAVKMGARFNEEGAESTAREIPPAGGSTEAGTPGLPKRPRGDARGEPPGPRGGDAGATAGRGEQGA